MTPQFSPSPPVGEEGIWQRLDDPAAARVLADAYTRQFFQPFIWRERLVSDVARELGVSKAAVLYRVRQFLRLGLLTVTRTEARAGRALKYYRASSRGYFVPFAATHADTVQALYEASLDHPRRSVLASLAQVWSGLADDARDYGLYTFGDERGLMSHALLPYRPAVPQRGGTAGGGMLGPLLADEAPAVWDNTATLSLSARDAKALQRDLYALHRRYQDCRDPAGESYLVRLTLTPAVVVAPSQRPS